VKPHVEKLLETTARMPSAMGTHECPDPEVTAEAAALIEYANQAESYFDEIVQGAAYSLFNELEPSPGDVIGTYRIIQAIGHGGMGSVYLAERRDGEIEQKVAIKLLRADTHRPGWRERFLRERQLLASLHHPCVVHVMDAGHTGDGRPFLVMEHVDGVPIDRYAAGIDVKERLKLFLRVCEGVSYAHRQLIIHRDLKPSNILVDGAGQPKLLDFGIAKLLDETGEVTQLADQLLTPNYASPEQLGGHAQSTATDVYSLGAVLYKLLTGAAPREREEAARAANGDIAPPSQVNPGLADDLNFVIGKALRPEPEDRYGSVEEFAGDVRAVLEHRPVEARSGDIWYRARRNLRRYWMPAVAAVAVVVSLSAGMWVANRERRIAERRFTDVRQLANKLFDIDVQVAQLQGGSKTRQMIVDTAMEYLRRVSVDVRMESGLELELGTAYMRVGRVQGVNISPNLGQTAEADKSEQRAQELIDSVLAEQPANSTALLRSAQIAHDRMTLASDAGRPQDEILQFARISVERINQYLAARRLNASSDRLEAQSVIVSLMNVAHYYMKADRFNEAIAIANRAIDIAHATNWPTQAGAALMIVAQSHRATGDLDAALHAIRESVQLLQPDEGETRSGKLQPYALALIREAQILGEDQDISLNRPGEAAAILQLAIKICEPFARSDPNDFWSQHRISFAEAILAAIVRHNNPDRAAELYRDAHHRIAGTAGNGSMLRNEAGVLAASVYPLLQLHRLEEARQNLDAAFDRLGRLKQYPAASIELGSPADNTLRAQAEYDAARGNFRLAAAEADELLRLIWAGGPKPDTSLSDAMELSNVYAGAARLHRLAGQIELAEGCNQRRRSLWREWQTKLPNNAFIRHQQALIQSP
jgi:tetratricopeptide (TPR) repeat protein/predicted Ser/Thr protein kinase